MSSLSNRAAAVLRGNDRGGHTVPSPHLYPHQWAWDSAFAAIGWAHLDLDRAVRELETLMATAWSSDGRVPHIYFHDLTGSYFPDPSFWRTERSSTITQPPVWATAARRVLELGGDAARIAALIPAIERSHAFFASARDPKQIGAVAIVHPWESGLDNSPSWDQALANVNPKDAPPFKRVDKERVADASERPTDDQYARYAALVKHIADNDFGSGPFQVYDPLMTSLLARAERDLAAIAEQLGVDVDANHRADRLDTGLETLFSETHGYYRFKDALTDTWIAPDVISAYMPLVVPTLPENRRRTLQDGLAKRYHTAWPLPSTAPSDDAFDPRCYWRGPTWINIGWLLAPHTELPVRERSLALMEEHGFREYYHPETGEGLGAKDFTWSAALALDWLAQD